MNVTAEKTFLAVKTYDAGVSMPDQDFSGTREQVHASILDDLDWAENLCGEEVPATVTLNTDRAENPITYFLVWHMNDGTTQTDIFTLTET